MREREVAFDVQEFYRGLLYRRPGPDNRNALVAAGISVPAQRFEVNGRWLVRVIRDLAAEEPRWSWAPGPTGPTGPTGESAGQVYRSSTAGRLHALVI